MALAHVRADHPRLLASSLRSGVAHAPALTQWSTSFMTAPGSYDEERPELLGRLAPALSGTCGRPLPPAGHTRTSSVAALAVGARSQCHPAECRPMAPALPPGRDA